MPSGWDEDGDHVKSCEEDDKGDETIKLMKWMLRERLRWNENKRQTRWKVLQLRISNICCAFKQFLSGYN